MPFQVSSKMIYVPEEDSYLLQKVMKPYCPGKSVLDMGSGSGILAEAALKSRASSVLAVDIQDDVIRHLRELKIPAVKSDLFSKIKGKFELIIFNPPYLPLDEREDRESRIVTTGGKKGDEIILKFLEQAKLHVKKDSIILLLISSLTPKTRIKKALKTGFSSRKIAEKRIFQEVLEIWEIKYNNQ